MLLWRWFQYVWLGLGMCFGIPAVIAQSEDEQEFQQINMDMHEISKQYNKITTLAKEAFEADRNLRHAIQTATLDHKIQRLSERVNRLRNRPQWTQRTTPEDHQQNQYQPAEIRYDYPVPQKSPYQIRPQNQQTGPQNQPNGIKASVRNKGGVRIGPKHVSPEPKDNKYSFSDPLSGKKYTVTAHARIFSARQFLDRHNFYRARMRSGQETDRNAVPELQDLHWNAKLAEGAKAWAEQCIYKHPDSLDVGENIVYSSGAIGDPVELWYEYRYDTKHYDQMVSPRVLYLGCYMALCPKLQVVKSSSVADSAYYSVCRYSSRRVL